MAAIITESGRIVFKLDTGEIKDEKPVYRNVSLGGVEGEADAESLAAVANAISGVIALEIAGVSLQRNEILEF